MSTQNNFDFISLNQPAADRAQAIFNVLRNSTLLDLFIVGMLPQATQLSKWKWDQKIEDGEKGYPKGYILTPGLLKHTPKAKLSFGVKLEGLTEAQVVAKLNYLQLLKAEKGSVLPQSWIEALSGPLPLYWSADTRNTSPYLLRLAKAFGRSVTVCPDKPDREGIWLGNKTPYLGDDNSWKGPVLSEAELMPHFWLQEANFTGYLECITTQKEDDKILLYDTLWVEWKESGVVLPGIRRENRDYYTLRVGGDHHWIDDPHVLWGNQLVWWSVNGTSPGAISKAVNRDSTQLVAPARLYGDPSPLNKAQDKGTVGHLALELPPVAALFTGMVSMLPDIWSDTDCHAPVIAAEFAYEAGLPVLYQHQLETTRIGTIAAACGKSTINIVVQLANGKLRQLKCSIGQFLSDKATKIFNRDSLLGRVPALVTIIRKDDQPVDNAGMDAFTNLASKLLGF